MFTGSESMYKKDECCYMVMTILIEGRGLCFTTPLKTIDYPRRLRVDLLLLYQHGLIILT